MKKHIPLLLFLIFTASSSAREWVDRNGLVVDATVYQMNAHSVGLRLKSGQVVEVRKEKLSQLDQEYLGLMERHKNTSQRLRLQVFQATGEGALCAVYRAITVTKKRRVPSHYSKLQEKQYYTNETYQEVENVKIYDLAYVPGLTTVVDDEILDVIVWGDGNYSYTAVNNAKKSVPKFSLEPIISSRPIQQFGQ
jgi:hypothetical protein